MAKSIAVPGVLTMDSGLDRILEAFQTIISLKTGKRNNTSDQKRVQMVHDMTKEMGVSRECTGKPTKSGARFSKEDMTMVEKIHDHAVNLGAECGPNTNANYPEAKSGATSGDSEVHSPTSTEVHSPTSTETSTEAYTAGNVTVTGGAGDGDTIVTITQAPKDDDDGDITFADETNKKYPIDTEADIRAAWSYFNLPKTAKDYSTYDLETIKGKIIAAWKEEIDKAGPPVAGGKKNNSIMDLVNDIRGAWYGWWEEPDGILLDYPEDCDEPGESGYCFAPSVVDVLDDSIIIQLSGKEYRVGYTTLGVDDYDFDAPEKWTQVEYTWEDVTGATASEGQVKSGLVTSFGSALKTGEDGHLRGYLIRFTTPKDPDIDKDFFTKETDFGVEFPTKSATFFHHCLPLKTKDGGVIQIKEKIGEGTLEQDDFGILIDAIIYNNMKYRAALLKSTKSLGWSSGTAQHLVIREKKDGAWWIKRWPLGLDATITPMPAEPRNEVVSMKSLQTPLFDFEPEDGTEGAVSVVPSVKGHGATKSQTPNGDITMEAKELVSAFKMALSEHEAEKDAAIKKVKDAEAAEAAKKTEIADAVASALKTLGFNGKQVRQPVNAGAAKTAQPAPGKCATTGKTEYGDDAFKAFNFYLKTGDREALRDLDRERGEDGALLEPENFAENVKRAREEAGLKTTYNVLEITQYQGQELVPTEVYDKIIELRDPVSIARVGGATVIPIGARTMNVPVEKNRSGKFVIANEGSSFDANAVQPFDKRAITAFKFTRTIGMGIEVLEDSVADLTNWWTRHVARMEALTENYYFVMGAAGGASTPEGIIGGGTAAITSAAGAVLTAAEVVKLFYKLPQPYRDNPSFMCNGNTEGVIRSLSGNWFQFQPTPSGSGGGNFPMGSDWIVSPKCKLLVASDMADIAISAKSAIVGNWAEYIIAERSAMSIFRDPYSSAASGLVNFHCHFRRGGMVGITEAFQYLTGNSA